MRHCRYVCTRVSENAETICKFIFNITRLGPHFVTFKTELIDWLVGGRVSDQLIITSNLNTWNSLRFLWNIPWWYFWFFLPPLLNPPIFRLSKDMTLSQIRSKKVSILRKSGLKSHDPVSEIVLITKVGSWPSKVENPWDSSSTHMAQKAYTSWLVLDFRVSVQRKVMLQELESSFKYYSSTSWFHDRWFSHLGKLEARSCGESINHVD